MSERKRECVLHSFPFPFHPLLFPYLSSAHATTSVFFYSLPTLHFPTLTYPPLTISTPPLPSLPQQDERDLEVTGMKQKKETALIIDTEEKAKKVLFQSLSDTASSAEEDSVFRAIQFMDKRYTLSTYSVLTPPVVPTKIESFGAAKAVAVTEIKPVTETVPASPVKGKMHCTLRILFDTL